MKLTILIAMALGAAACVDGASTGEAAHEIQGETCTVLDNGEVLFSNGFWLDHKTCCRRALSNPNEQWCYVCGSTEGRHLYTCSWL